MVTNFSLSGLNQPSVKLELGGSVYFMHNLRDCNYELVRAAFRNGKLCMDFKPRKDAKLPERIVAARNYINLEPHEDISLRIKAVEEYGDMAYVTIFVVTSTYNPNGYMQFSMKKFESHTKAEFDNYASIYNDEEELLGRGFTCTMSCTNEPFYASNTFFAIEDPE